MTAGASPHAGRGRPRLLPLCPVCGGPLLVVSTTRQGHCVCRNAVCDACGKTVRQVETPGGHAFFCRRAATDAAPPTNAGCD